MLTAKNIKKRAENFVKKLKKIYWDIWKICKRRNKIVKSICFPKSMYRLL